MIAVLGVYQPAWHGDFVWEDELYANTNPLLSATDGLRRIWFSFDSPAQYFPLTHTVFRLGKGWLGAQPTSLHLVNILCHAGASLVLWRLLQRLRVPGAWLGAALFALHPVQVESVAQISELKNVLMGLCFIASLYFWVVYREKRRTYNWLASFGCYLLALAAKSTACVLPAALLLILWLRKERISRKSVLELLPFLLASVVSALTALAWEKLHNTADWIVNSSGWIERLLIASRAVFFYLGKLVWPGGLTFNYPGWDISRFHPTDYLWLLAVLLLAGVVYLARRRLGRGPEVVLLFFVGALSPLLGFVGVYTFRYTYVADHYQYLACIGPLALFAAGCDWAARGRRYVSLVLAACILTVLSWLTWSQSHIYKSGEALWLDTIRKNPGSWMAENNYGIILRSRGKLQTALAHFQRSYDLAPNNPEGARNVGLSYLELHQPGSAIPYLQQAARINPRDPKGGRDLARGLLESGRSAEAIDKLNDVLALDPNDAKAHTLMASALLTEGRYEETRSHLRAALALQPDDIETQTQLANLSLQLRQYGEAAELLRQIVARRPDDADALKNYAWLLATAPDAGVRNGARAVELAERARAGAPQNPFIQATLAAAYAEAGQFHEARLTAEAALQFADQNNLGALANLLRQEIALSENSQAYRDVR
ncbi:MAG: tetratricopeptide repeat protein [Chthoniobacterales bacterium]